MSIKIDLNNKKLIAVDLDGTLLQTNKRCSLKTTNYLKDLKEKGHIIVVATGRILSSAIHATEGAEFANYIVSDAGAIIYNNEEQSIISKNIINNLDVIKICSEYETNWSKVNICDNENYNIYTNKYYEIENFEKLILDKEEFLKKDKEITHISIILKQNEVEKIKKKLQTKLPHLKITIMQDSFSDKKWIEVFNEGVSKYNTIKLIADRENIDVKDIICFGDGLNDIDMIKRSGVGVAMGNALPEIKENAKYITLSNDEDGIKFFLEKYLI